MTFTCPFCGMTSRHPQDVAERYCGSCHVFVDDVEERRSFEGRSTEGLERNTGEIQGRP